MDFLCGYLTFYLAILGGYCIQYIRTHFRTTYSTDDNTVQSVLNPVLPRIRGFKKLKYTLNSGDFRGYGGLNRVHYFLAFKGSGVLGS